MKQLIVLLSMLAFVHTAAALDAKDVRGGWETDINGVRHIYEFKIRGDRVTGVYCTDCSDATTLAFIEGSLGADGISFVVTHVKNDGSTAYQDHATGKIDNNGQLMVTGHSGAPGGGQFQWTMHKDPRGPTPPAPAGARPPPPHYLQPAAWESLTPEKLEGTWLAGSGPNKQYFIIRKVGDQLRGVACGPCDNPYTMGMLEEFFVQGDGVLFDVCHEDWGNGPLPYLHKVIAHVAKNEMRMDAAQDNMKRIFSMTLIGPLAPEATARQ